MTFSAQDVAVLRQKTGAGMMECKNALKEANGDIEKAREILRQKGIIQASRKAEKSALEGIVVSKISNDKKTGAIVEVNTQTDFVARNEMFIKLTDTISSLILVNKPKSIEDLLKIKTGNGLLSELISTNIATVGENIQVRRFDIFELKNNTGIIGSYIHPVGRKIGVLIKLLVTEESPTCIVELEELAKNLAMHIAAAQPQAEYIDKSMIPQDIIENEKRIEMGKEDLAKKPKEIAEKIVQGRLDKILAQRCLLEQPYIKDQALIIDKVIKDKSKQLNIDIKVSQFVRYNVGETLEKSQAEDKSTVTIS